MGSPINLDEIRGKLTDIFRSRNVEEAFENYFVAGGRTKLNILSKAIEHVGICTEDDDDEDSDKNKAAISILKTVLKMIMRSFHTNSEEVNDVALSLLNGAGNFSSTSLSHVAAYCLEHMGCHVDSDVPTLWIEVFGHIVSILTSRKEVKYDGDTLTGKEFRTAMVTQLCRLNWQTSNSSYIIAATREFPELDLPEVDNVVHKAFQVIKNFDPPSVPPIAYQLLLLAADKRPELLLQNFDDYFQGMMFQDTAPTSTQTNSGAGTLLKRKALGTVVFHFIHSARHTSSLIKQILKRIKHAKADHTLIMTPFMLAISLGLTSVEHYKLQVVESLCRSIINSLEDIRNCQTNAWYRSSRGEVKETFMNCFKSVIDSKSSELDFMLDGLRDLALALLKPEEASTEALYTINKCQTLGAYIITSIVSKHNDYFPRVRDELLKNKRSLVHINCLASCLRSLIRKIVQEPEKITELINHLPLMTVETSTPIVKSLIPSFQLSRKLLSELIVILRKTVYKSTEARKISAQAMILLLSNSKIIGAIPRSQYSESQNFFSQATQTQVDILGTARENESLCFEVLWILKRFFTQPSEVREQLYLGLHVVSRKNPELIKVICSHLVTQVHNHMQDRTEIKWSGLLGCSGPDESIAAEHLGFLLQCVSFVTLRGRRIYRQDCDEQPESLIDCENLLDSWTRILSKVSKDDIEHAVATLPDSSIASLRPLESAYYSRSKKNSLTLQILQGLEALIEFEALKCFGRNDKNIEKLFRKILELEPLLKPPSTSNGAKKDKEKNKSAPKKKKGKAKDDGTSTSQSRSSNDSQHERIKLKREEPKPLIFLHILNIESILEVLKLQTGSNTETMNLRNLQKPFEKYILLVIQQKVERLKKNENLGERERKPEEVVNNIASIAGALWEICRKRLDSTEEENMEIDDSTQNEGEVQIMEVDNTALTSLRFEILLGLVEFLVEQNTISFEGVVRLFNFEVYDDKSFEDMFDDFFQAWVSVVTLCTENQGNSKALEFLFSILGAFGKALSPGNSQSANKAVEWCMNYAKTPKEDMIASRELSGIIMGTILTIGSKLDGYPEKHFQKLARHAHCLLGDVDDEADKFIAPNEERPWIINRNSASVVICSIGLYVEESLGFVTGIIQRLKVQSLYYQSEKLERMRDKVCSMLTFLINLSTELIRSCFTAGPCVDILQRVMDQVFITTTLLAEHLIELHTRNKMEFTAKKFANLVKLIGTDFKLRVEALINHIECIQRDKAEELMKAKKGGRVPAAMKQKFTKDARTIPTLIYHVEKYEQQLYALGQKAKVNLLAGTKLSTARDFRIEVKELKEALADTNDKKRKNKTSREENSDSTSDSSNQTNLQQNGLSELNEDSNSTRLSSRSGAPLKRRKT